MPQDPPVAQRRPSAHEYHGVTREDCYSWLGATDDSAVVDYLRAENDWCEQQTQHLEPIVNELLDELETRTVETELSLPQLVHHTIEGRRRTYWYYSRTRKGQQYPVLSRLSVRNEAPPDPWAGPEGEEILLDGNLEASSGQYFGLGPMRVSPDSRVLAYGVDRDGDERYVLHLKDLATGMPIDTPIHDTAAHLAWAGVTHLFYTRYDDSRRPFQVFRHRLGTDPASDVLIMTEEDEKLWLALRESRDRRWVLITAGSPTTSETRILSCAEPEAAFRVVAPRTAGLKYRVELAGDRLMITHNRDGADFALAQAPLEATSLDQWAPVIPHTPGTRIQRADAYAGHIVVSLRREGTTALTVLPRTTSGGLAPGEDVAFDDLVHKVSVSPGPNYDDTTIRVSYTSLITPPTIYGYQMVERKLRQLKEMPVLDHPELGSYDPGSYRQTREWATAEDGTKIPMSVVAHRDTPRDGSAPAILYGYGAYETALDPSFDGARISALDRGFVFAIAHVRGGGELGRPWYLAGKKRQKMNSFTDFLACARHLVDRDYADPKRVAAQGASAGGLLVAGAITLEPELFRAAQLDVPFVDPLTTGLDPDAPLTVTEWEEWGDPLHDPEAFAYIKSYSPYENVRSARYPAMLITASLNDTRVKVSEAAKWVARLRAETDPDPDRPLLLKTELEAGHGGVSGRYEQWRETAFTLAWLMDQLDPEKAARATEDVAEQAEA